MNTFNLQDLAALQGFSIATDKMIPFLKSVRNRMENIFPDYIQCQRLNLEKHQFTIDQILDDHELSVGFNWSSTTAYFGAELIIYPTLTIEESILLNNNWAFKPENGYKLFFKCIPVNDLMHSDLDMEEFQFEKFIAEIMTEIRAAFNPSRIKNYKMFNESLDIDNDKEKQMLLKNKEDLEKLINELEEDLKEILQFGEIENVDIQQQYKRYRILKDLITLTKKLSILYNSLTNSNK